VVLQSTERTEDLGTRASAGRPVLWIILLAAIATSCSPIQQSSPPATTAQSVSSTPSVNASHACLTALGPVLRGLTQLQASLTQKMAYPQYSAAVQDIRNSYEKVDSEGLNTCVSRVGIPAGNAVNHYTAALIDWHACIVDSANCSPSLNDRRLQIPWAAADQDIVAAINGLASLGLGSGSTSASEMAALPMLANLPTLWPPLPVSPGPGLFIPYPGNGGGPTRCADGTYSHSSGRGTCSHHGGEA
jgi:hypothetical protein